MRRRTRSRPSSPTMLFAAWRRLLLQFSERRSALGLVWARRPSSSSSPWRSARGVRARAFGVFSCAPLGLASQRALRRAAGGRRRARRRSRAALFWGSAALWFLAAVRRSSRLLSPGGVAGLEIQYRWTAVRDQEAARRAATPDQSLSSKSVPSPFPTLMFEKYGESSSPAMALEESPRSSRLRVKASAVRH